MILFVQKLKGKKKHFFSFAFTSLIMLGKNCELNNLKYIKCIYLFIMLGIFNGTFNISDYTALTVK
jgi:hypothetical protein